MPRGYLKNCRGIPRKAARGGGSRPSLKIAEKILRERKGKILRDNEGTKDLPGDHLERKDPGRGGTPKLGHVSAKKLRLLDCAPTGDEGVCSLCGKWTSLQRLTKRCRHESACLSCLHQRFIEEAQQSTTNYPLGCFHPSCQRRIRAPHIALIAKDDEEIRRHEGMHALAIQKQHAGAFCQNSNNAHLDPMNDISHDESCSRCRRRSLRKFGFARSFVTHELKLLVDRYSKLGINQFHQTKPLSRRMANLIKLQRNFRQQRKPWTVDTGYHYTNAGNRNEIDRHGLLTPGDRKQRSVQPVYENGQAYGPGIYLANSPYAHSSYGSTGLVCARLKGVETTQMPNGNEHCRATVIGCAGSQHEFCVLPTSTQCVVLFEFKRPNRSWQSSLNEFHNALENVLNKMLLQDPKSTRE